jgi:hypothetical protein
MGQMGNAYNTLDGKPEGKRILVRPKRRWNSNIRMEMCGLDSSGSG